MTHSAGHRGHKASAAAASKDNELYGGHSQEIENWPVRKGIGTRKDSSRQSADRQPADMVKETMDRGNR